MSCNGCRVLRKRCSDTCALRSCLQWIESAESQAHATLFLAKFFGRSDLLSLISSVPETKRPALFQSLLYEGCGRTINPVNGAVGLLCSDNWHACQAAVDTVLAGGVLQPLPETFAGVMTPALDDTVSKDTRYPQLMPLAFMHGVAEIMNNSKSSLDPEFYGNITSNRALKFSGSGESNTKSYGDYEKKRVLNLFL